MLSKPWGRVAWQSKDSQSNKSVWLFMGLTAALPARLDMPNVLELWDKAGNPSHYPNQDPFSCLPCWLQMGGCSFEAGCVSVCCPCCCLVGHVWDNPSKLTQDWWRALCWDEWYAQPFLCPLGPFCSNIYASFPSSFQLQTKHSGSACSHPGAPIWLMVSVSSSSPPPRGFPCGSGWAFLPALPSCGSSQGYSAFWHPSWSGSP